MNVPRLLPPIASFRQFALVSALAPVPVSALAYALALVSVGCSPDRPVLPEPGSYELHDALEIHLFAAEPDVVDPVALAFDAAERMYVVEMRDYPEGMPSSGRPGGTIRLLEDIDRDGRADRSTVFASDLSFPTSVAPWKGGVFVTAPPQILYLEDTDGDRRADVREVVFDGFTLGVTDSNVNGLRWAIDNRFHGANGGNGGTVGETSLRGLDFRFDPRTRRFETTYRTAGGFGLIFDEWGRSFAPYNIDHLQQRVLPVRYLARNAALPPVDATLNVSVHGAMARIFPISRPATRPNHPEQAGHYSSAGGIGWLDFAGEELSRGILVCDVVGNLVSREVAREDGPLFVTERAPEERAREFFASRDPAFRPIGVEMGPDGALYLIDMQRDTIEHPDYIPEARRRGLDLRAGSDRGRIYRIVPRAWGAGAGAAAREAGRGPPAREPLLADLDIDRLVAELGSPSRWRRDTAQRLLYEAGASSLLSLEPLRAMAHDGERPLGRLHALRALEGLGAADEALVIAALADPHPGVRENALQVAEGLLPGSDELHERILGTARDPSARVRFQAALTVGELDDPRRLGALVEVLRRDAAFRFTRVAVESGLEPDEAIEVLSRILVSDPDDDADLPGELGEELAGLAGAELGEHDGDALAAVLEAVLDRDGATPHGGAVLTGLADGIGRAENPPLGDSLVGALLDRAMDERRGGGARAVTSGRSPDGALEGAQTSTTGALPADSMARVRSAWILRRALRLDDGPPQRAALARASATARDRSRAVAERATALDVLAMGPPSEAAAALAALLGSNEPSGLEARAVRALGGLEASAESDGALGALLVSKFRALGPEGRVVALDLLLRRSPFHADLMAALEDRRLTVGELHLDLEQRRRLLRSDAPGVASRAAALLHDDDYGGRAGVVETWLERLPEQGSAERGRAVFDRLCAQCHRAGGAGHEVGPGFAGLAHRSAEDLVSNILDPDLAIHPDYVAFEVVTKAGEREIGLIANETSEAVELLQAGGERRVIPRTPGSRS